MSSLIQYYKSELLKKDIKINVLTPERSFPMPMSEAFVT